MKRYSYKRLVFDNQLAMCYHCHKNNALYGLYDDRDKSEVFSCDSCLWIIGKIKKFCSYPSNTITLRKSKEKTDNLGVEKWENGVLKDG